MAESLTIPATFMVILLITRLMSIIGKSKPYWTTLLPPKLLTLEFSDKLCNDPKIRDLASKDYGNIIHKTPFSVLLPTSVQDIISLVKFAYNSPIPFTIATRGNGHSVHGQAMARNGIVIDMKSLRDHKKELYGGSIQITKSVKEGLSYVDVGGEQLWIDVLHGTLEHGLVPLSWTDYLYLTVGGTLSNAGISGQTFRYGPQISNVLELDVVNGKGELVTCSPQNNSKLFYAVLGGLGQFGIITRARIPLQPAPKRVKWLRILYDDFTAFTRDQERLISNSERKERDALDYLEGLLLMNQGPPNNWRSSFFPSIDVPRIMSLVTQHGIIYCLEVAKHYDDATQHTVDKELQELFKGLSYIPGFMFEKDVSYVEFLDRVRSGELKLQSQGLWEVPHPWLNLFLPKSQITQFNSGVFHEIIAKGNISSGPILFYPMNRSKWDDKMSVVIPKEEVFYTVGFLHSSGFGDWQAYVDQNTEILEFCEKAGIEIKQYFPHYTSKEEWSNHFGSKWITFQDRKAMFDPKKLLSPGQRIFN